MLFDQSKCPLDKKLHNFTKYVRRQSIARFLAQYELFKRQLNIKVASLNGVIMRGSNGMGKISSILEPYNYHE